MGKCLWRYKPFGRIWPCCPTSESVDWPLMWGRSKFQCFTNASELRTCVYARTVNPKSEVKVMLLTSAPLNKRSIPRLELCAQLSSRDVATLKVETTPFFYWTDSTEVLHWLRTPPQTFKTFVSNRLADIHSLMNSSRWFHVPEVSNHVDHVSRRMPVPKQQIMDPWFRLVGRGGWTENYHIVVSQSSINQPFICQFIIIWSIITNHCVLFVILPLYKEGTKTINYCADSFLDWNCQRSFG